jgi:homopolymeric O-antigen transport system ATP-binding protein
MHSDIAIHTEGLNKSYHLYPTPRDRLKQLVFGRRGKYYDEFRALSDVSFDVRRGETVGIIGRNGSGKSTLLQIVCGTLPQTAGVVETSGRIAAMLELGAGFDPEFTGRENVYLNGELVGLSHRQIDARYASIREFADIGEFIDHPVKTYSSGMQMRLAFAVMAHIDADVLVIDEALAVGDALFVQKCMRFLRAFKRSGTLLFVTHDTPAVMSLCDRAIWLDRGRIRADGTSKSVCEAYLQFLFESVQGESQPSRRGDAAKAPSVTMPESPSRPKASSTPAIPADAQRAEMRVFEFDPDVASFGLRGAQVVNVSLLGDDDRSLAHAEGGETVTVAVVIEARRSVATPIVGFLVRDRLGQSLFGDNTFLTTQTAPVALSAGDRAEARFSFELPLLPPGHYSINVAIAEGTQEQHVQHEWINDALIFSVETSSIRHSLVGIQMRSVELRRV